MFVCLFTGNGTERAGLFFFSTGVCRFAVFPFFRRRDVAVLSVCV